MNRLLVAAVIALPIAAQAADVEIGAGVCAYYQQDVGGWWEASYEHRSMTPACATLGVSNTLAERVNGRIGWRIAYTDLGHAKLNEVAWGGPGVQPHWVATGEGRADALSLGIFREWSGRTTKSLEAGIFAYRMQWYVSAEHRASGLTNTYRTDEYDGVSLYVGAEVARRVGTDTSLFANARWYSFMRSNNMHESGDYVGAKYTHPVALQVGVRAAF